LIDDIVIQGCKRSDRKSQRAFYEFCYPILARVGYRYAKNDDEIQEIINEAFMRLIKKIERFEDLNISHEAYIWRAGVNTAIDLFRKSKNYKKLIRVESSMPVDWTPMEAVTKNELDSQANAKHILKIMATLPEPTKTILNLFAIDGYAHKEISKMLGIKETLSRWHLHKARKIMKEKLSPIVMKKAYGE
jgi:RNA polymerase sigma-70 factor (ECF subfamily)